MINILVTAQKSRNLTDIEMGRRLGISRIHWNNAKHGRVNLSSDVYLRAKANFPEVACEVDAYLSRNISVVKEEGIGPPTQISRVEKITRIFHLGRRG